MSRTFISIPLILRVLHALYLRRKHTEISTVLANLKGHSFLEETIHHAHFIPFNTSTGQDPQILLSNSNTNLIKTPPVDPSRGSFLPLGISLAPNIPHPFHTLSQLTLRIRLDANNTETTTSLQINLPLLTTEKTRVARLPASSTLPRKLELWAHPNVLEVRYPSKHKHDQIPPVLRYEWLSNASTSVHSGRFTPYGMRISLEMPLILTLLTQLKLTLTACLHIDPTLTFETNQTDRYIMASLSASPSINSLPKKAPLFHQLAPLAILIGSTVKTLLTTCPSATIVFKTSLNPRTNEWQLLPPNSPENSTTHTLDYDYTHFDSVDNDPPITPLFGQITAQHMPATVHHHMHYLSFCANC